MDLTDSFNRLKQQINNLAQLKFFKIGFIGISAAFFGLFMYWTAGMPQNLSASLRPEEETITLGAFPIKMPTIRYGFAIDTFHVFDDKIKSGQFLGDLLLAQKVDYPSIEKIIANSKGLFSVNELREGNPYTILTKDSSTTADYFIYEPNIYEYIIFHLKDDYKVMRIKRPITVAIKAAMGEIESSLWQAMTDGGMSYELADKMEDALQWSVDFHHLQKGDQFKLVYDETRRGRKGVCSLLQK